MVGASRAAGAQSPARGVHAPHTMALWRGGDAGTVALAQSRRWSRYLPAQPRNDARGLPPGAVKAPPRPALPLSASSRSKFGGDWPPAVLGAARGARGKAGWSARDLQPSRRAAGRQPSRGQLSPGTFSAAAGACVCEAVAPPAGARLPLPPPQHARSSPGAPSPGSASCPRAAPLLTSVIASRPALPWEPERASPAAAAEGNTLWRHRGSRNEGSCSGVALLQAPHDP